MVRILIHQPPIRQNSFNLSWEFQIMDYLIYNNIFINNNTKWLSLDISDFIKISKGDI